MKLRIGSAAVCNIVRADINIEAGEEIGDALIGKAALAQETNLVGKHAHNLFAREKFVARSSGLTKLGCGTCDLGSAIGSIRSHDVLLALYLMPK